MKNHRNTRGQMRVIETILAAFIIFAALSFMGILAVAPPSSGYEVTDLEQMGYSALHDLDQQGLLAPLVYNSSRWSELGAFLKITMPVGVYYNLAIYDINWEKLNYKDENQIVYGDSATFSRSKNIASVSYNLVGVPRLNTDTGTYEALAYDPRILVLQITRG